MRVAYVPAAGRAGLTSASKCKPGLHNLIRRDTRVRTFNFAGYRSGQVTPCGNSNKNASLTPPVCGIPPFARVNISIGFRSN